MPQGGALRSTAFSLFLFLFLAVSGHAGALDTAAAGHDERFVAGEALTIDVVLDTVAFLNGGYPIDSSGYVELPVLGKFMVGGRTRDEVEAYLASKLANYL